jgi:UPF0755 protein
MSQARRSRRSRTSRRRLSALQIAIRFLILSIVVGTLGIAAALVSTRLNQRGDPVAVEFNLSASSALSPVQAAVLRAQLALNEEAIHTPVSDDPTPVTFEVISGQNARQIADSLYALGLVSDPDLLQAYLQYYGLDRQLEAGTHQLAPNMTIAEIAVTLVDATPPSITIRVTEGWRREQIADYIDQQPGSPFSGDEFLAATASAANAPAGSGILLEVPIEASLEGFLFPDTYRVALDATAVDFVDRLLNNMDERFDPQLRADASLQGLTVYDAVILASIVEREAVIAEERPLIASVYLNRLRVGMLLEADPTVQYAMGYQPDTGQWWNLNLTQQDYHTVDSPYNTYLYPGLPPTPIANPGLDSIRAVIYPAETPYFFFRATCDESGAHVFAETFEEHLANACP